VASLTPKSGSPLSAQLSGAGGSPRPLGLSDYGLSDFGLSDFELSDFEPSDFELSDFELSDFELSDFELSDFELSDFELSDFELSDFQEHENVVVISFTRFSGGPPRDQRRALKSERRYGPHDVMALGAFSRRISNSKVRKGAKLSCISMRIDAPGLSPLRNHNSLCASHWPLGGRKNIQKLTSTTFSRT
jgi:hypothetical protein